MYELVPRFLTRPSFFGLPCERNRDSSVKPPKVRGITGITLLPAGIGTLVASYSANCGEDKDEAAANHRLTVKLGEDHVYAPKDGFTTPVPHFKDDINALLRLLNFDLPPLGVVRPSHVVHV